MRQALEDVALALLRQALRVWKASGYRFGVAFVQSLLQSGQVQFYIATALVGLLVLAWCGGARP